MPDWFTAEAGLASLAAASFLAATLVPLSSEAALVAALKAHPELYPAALAVATACNTLGGMTTYLIGRFLATRKPLRQIETLRRWGPAGARVRVGAARRRCALHRRRVAEAQLDRGAGLPGHRTVRALLDCRSGRAAALTRREKSRPGATVRPG